MSKINSLGEKRLSQKIISQQHLEGLNREQQKTQKKRHILLYVLDSILINQMRRCILNSCENRTKTTNGDAEISTHRVTKAAHRRNTENPAHLKNGTEPEFVECD